MDLRGEFGEHERSNYSLLSALQTAQVHHIAKKIAFHSRPQSPSFLGHVVGKRATGRLQIKPSGSGDENDRFLID